MFPRGFAKFSMGFDLVRHGADAWGDLDALTYVVQSGQTGEGALVAYSALLDGVSE